MICVTFLLLLEQNSCNTDIVKRAKVDDPPPLFRGHDWFGGVEVKGGHFLSQGDWN